MRESQIRKLTKLFLLALSTVLMLSACQSGGDTDGGSAVGNLSDGDQYVADGGAGATLVIDAPDVLTVGETEGFRVYLKDPQGQPLAYVRLSCDSEKGIAILEPSSGGVSFEHTGPNGDMSGVIGGLTPGSYIMECRAPEGFGLKARAHIIVKGTVPVGFVGFPGAAGGNLGGGLLIDQTPDDGDIGTDNGSVRIQKIEFTDGDDKSFNGPIDITQSTCDNGTPLDPSDDYDEPFYFNEFILTVSNTLTQRIFIDSVDMTVQNSSSTSIQTQFGSTDAPKQVEIAAGSAGVVSALFTEFQGYSAAKLFVGTSTPVAAGTYRIDFVVGGTADDGTPFTIAASATLTFDAVNRCGG